MTLGIVDAAWTGLQDRSAKKAESGYDFANWATLGISGTLIGAVNPEDPLSAEHWLDSIAVAGLVVGGAKALTTNKQGLTTTTTGTSVAEGTGSSTTRVGRWMSEDEYNKMIETGKVQMSPNGNTTYVANPANPNAFKAAPNGSIYVEFDVPTGSINPAGNANWGQISGPGSLMDRLNQSKGLPPINGMPDATNIKIPGR